MAADFGGANTAAGKVTGIMPDTIDLTIVDYKFSYTSFQQEYLTLEHVFNGSGTVIVNESLGFNCYIRDQSTISNNCRDIEEMQRRALFWIELVRARGLESKFLHFISAGNRDDSDGRSYDNRDAATFSSVNAAALMTDLGDATGTSVAPLSNVLVIENVADSTDEHPASLACLSENSFIGGHLSAVGTTVTSLTLNGTDRWDGTSMATPQASGLATFLLGIDRNLSVQKLKEILLNTAQPVPQQSDPACSDVAAAPAIDAYAAVLALDDENALRSGDRSKVKVRHALLDMASSDGTTEEPDGKFDEGDLIFFLNKIEEGNDDFEEGKGVATYGRADLNGDGYVGGRQNKKRFNLDANYPPAFEKVTQDIEEREVSFDEASLSDEDVMCYYVYSDLYVGDTEQRKNLMEGRCITGQLAVYYHHLLTNNFPKSNSNCETDNVEDVVEETIDTLPEPPQKRPSSHYWFDGDSHVYQNGLNDTQVRSRRTTVDGEQVCESVGTFLADATIDSSLSVEAVPGQEGIERLYVDIENSAASDCFVDPDHPENWNCSTASAVSSWHAEFELKVATAKDVTLHVQLDCTGRVAGALGISNVRVFGIRYIDGDFTNPSPLTNMTEPQKHFIPFQAFCDDNNPKLEISQLVEFDKPAADGDEDLVVFIIDGKVLAMGNLGNQEPVPEFGIPEAAPLGTDRHDVSMNGFVSVEPVQEP